MRSRFHAKPRPNVLKRLFLAGAIACALIGLTELYRWIIPFRSANPLWQEVTIGQPVIDEWMYGGQDAEGYLKFYNQGQTVLLPPDTKMFDADGKFVMIEHFTPGSLTFAKPYEAIPLKWIVYGALGMAGVAGVIAFRWQRRPKQLALRPARKDGHSAGSPPRSVVFLRMPTKPKRFRSHRKTRRS